MECLSQWQLRDEVLTQQPVLSQIKGDYQSGNRENSHFLSVLGEEVGVESMAEPEIQSLECRKETCWYQTHVHAYVCVATSR